MKITINILLFIMICNTGISQTLYVPINPDSIKVPVNVSGTVRTSYVIDLTKNNFRKTDTSTILESQARAVNRAAGITAKVLADSLALITRFKIIPQIITSGSTATVTDSTTVFIINPASALSTMTITLPTATRDKRVDFFFGGTVNAASTTVVTNLIFSPNSGQGLVGTGTIGIVNTEDHITWFYISSISKWFKL